VAVAGCGSECGRAGQRGAAVTSGAGSTVPPDSVFLTDSNQTKSNLFQTDSKFSKL
jgi:hypothetical protein